jgi:hypothetical protein
MIRTDSRISADQQKDTETATQIMQQCAHNEFARPTLRHLFIGVPTEQVQHEWRQNNALGFNQPVTKMSTRSREIMFLESRARSVRKADNLTAICEPTV